LAGFDFPLGYPRGFGAAIRARLPFWRGVWDEISGAIVDRADNSSNRFEAAAAFNRKVLGNTNGEGPFWGCPVAATVKNLSPRKPKKYPAGLQELRLCESWQPGPQSPWKLYTAGSVGSQALLGIPCVSRLCAEPDLHGHVKVWPFETGLTVPFGLGPEKPAVMIAEVWPSLIHGRAMPDEVKDQTQVRVLAEHLARLDKLGRLARLFAGPRELTGEQREIVETEEGWILGVL
jgi:precorrin-8X/cobalt-precorrin-8 methylmutase